MSGTMKEHIETSEPIERLIALSGTVVEAARRIGVPNSSLSQARKDRRIPLVYHLAAAQVLGGSLHILIASTTDEKKVETVGNILQAFNINFKWETL